MTIVRISDHDLAAAFDRVRELLLAATSPGGGGTSFTIDAPAASNVDPGLRQVVTALVFRDAVVDVIGAGGLLTEFVLGNGSAIVFEPPQEAMYSFQVLDARRLAHDVARHFASAPGGEAGAVVQRDLAAALDIPLTDLPAADARFTVRISFARGADRALVISRHGPAFAWIEPGSRNVAIVRSVDDLAALFEPLLAVR